MTHPRSTQSPATRSSVSVTHDSSRILLVQHSRGETIERTFALEPSIPLKPLSSGLNSSRIAPAAILFLCGTYFLEGCGPVDPPSLDDQTVATVEISDTFPAGTPIEVPDPTDSPASGGKDGENNPPDPVIDIPQNIEPDEGEGLDEGEEPKEGEGTDEGEEPKEGEEPNEGEGTDEGEGTNEEEETGDGESEGAGNSSGNGNGEVVGNEPPPKAPPALGAVKVPGPSSENLDKYIVDQKAAIVLGKALFWDMATGSDGQACASCHFHAGADNRITNQLSPGILRHPVPDFTFQATASGGMGGPNYQLVTEDFPFHQFEDPSDRHSKVVFSSNDIVSSQGTFAGEFIGVSTTEEDGFVDDCSRSPDAVFHVGGIGTRRVEVRNTPTVINAVFNFRNFWDGRANNIFNGVDAFGRRNKSAFIYNAKGEPVTVRLRNSSLASQAVAPILSDAEMSCATRSLADVGRKLIRRRSLAGQEVHPQDSVLAAERHASGLGLNKTYGELIKMAFHDEWWAGEGDFDGYTQMEVNFSLFWGLALQMYQATLISDESAYDRFAAGHTEAFEVEKGDTHHLTSAELRGLKVFMNEGRCINCHNGPEFSGSASDLQSEHKEGGLVERMKMGDETIALYDNSFYNIGVTPTSEDIGVGSVDPFGNPLSFTQQWVTGNLVDPFQVKPCTFEEPFDAELCNKVPADLGKERTAVKGAFKTPILRNIELTGPYMHNGSMSTLEQVVEFYNRGGNFHNHELDADIRTLDLTDGQQADLVAFMKSLTDNRVKYEEAPFDHPQLLVFYGHNGDNKAVVAQGYNLASDDCFEIPAVGRLGRKAENLPPIKSFIDGLGEGGVPSHDLTDSPQLITSAQ